LPTQLSLRPRFQTFKEFYMTSKLIARADADPARLKTHPKQMEIPIFQDTACRRLSLKFSKIKMPFFKFQFTGIYAKAKYSNTVNPFCKR